ncbi:MAG: DNA polymerase III subunit beta [Gemmataceae bacterium]|nr:DNA polymerase III subunit beta [Gemmataceae bacterium]
MKLLCRRERLLSAFQLASVAVPARDLKPVLRNVKAVVAEDRCSLLATDLELGIRLEVPDVPVEAPGEALLPAGRMLAILRESTDEELAVEADMDACLVRGEHTEFEMGGEDPATFPDVPAFPGERYHEVAAGVLREMVRRTAFAAATETARYALTGVLWELEGETARLVATDGRRLAVAQGPATAHGGHSTKGQIHVVPTKAMQLLERNLHDPDERVRVSLGPNEALFQTGRATVSSRLVEGRYPAYRDVIPKKPAVKISLAAGPFHVAVRQAAVMADQESRKVVFSFAKGKLTLRAQGAEAGRSRVELPLDYDGKALDIAFDPRLVTEMLRVLGAGDQLTLEMTDGTKPALFRCGDDFSYVVMPLA